MFAVVRDIVLALSTFVSVSESEKQSIISNPISSILRESVLSSNRYRIGWNFHLDNAVSCQLSEELQKGPDAPRNIHDMNHRLYLERKINEATKILRANWSVTGDELMFRKQSRTSSSDAPSISRLSDSKTAIF